MPSFKVIHLHFKSGLHLGKGKEGTYDSSADRLHSDKLKSALFVSAKRLYGDQIDYSFFEDFSISSAFPFLQLKNKEMVYFFPRPHLADFPVNVAEELPEKAAKRLRKVQYIDKNLLELLLQGPSQDIEIATTNFTENNRLLSQHHALEKYRIYKSQVEHHVSIPKPTSDGWIAEDSTPFDTDKLFFESNAGLFFLMQVESTEREKQLKAALRLLEDTGIGTDRTSGGGQLSISEGELSINVPSEGNYQLNLSLYCPKQDGIELNKGVVKKATYTLLKRGGYIANPVDDQHLSIRKKSIYMFEEGSVFPFQANRVGQIADLTPAPSNNFPTLGHPIWRDGTAIFLPIKQRRK